MTGFYKFAISVMRFIMPLWYKIDADGLENLPDEGGYLFVSNHRSNADPIIIGMHNPETQFCFLAKQELFSDGLVGWILKKLGAVAVDRGAGDMSPLEEIESRLENGENALIFPEGTRSKDGKLLRFKTGAALIAAQTGVPIVPVAISFEDELHFRSTIHVRYGKPFDVPQTNADDPSFAVLKQIRKEMTKQVSDLLEMHANEASAAIEMKTETKTDQAAGSSESAEKTVKKEEPVRVKPQAGISKAADNAEEDQSDSESMKDAFRTEQNPKNKKITEDTVETMGKNNKRNNHNNKPEDAMRKKKAAEEFLENAEDEAANEVEDIISGVDDAADDLDAFEEETAGAASSCKIKNPFKKLLKAIDSEDEFAAIEEELTADEEEEKPKKPAKSASAAKEKTESKEPKKNELKKADAPAPKPKKETEPETDQPEPEKDEEAPKPAKKKFNFTEFADEIDDPTPPAKKKAEKEQPEPVSDDELYDDEYDDEPEKGGLLGGLSIKNPFKKKDYDDDEYYDDEYDDEEYDEVDYDDDEDYEEGERHFDYGRIALILTFVILGIFAFDFVRRLRNDWLEQQGMLDIQSQASSNVESMNGESSEATATMTGITSTAKPVSGTTIATTTSTTSTDITSSTSATTTTILDTRETETISMDNSFIHSGSLVLIDADHQLVNSPSLISFADIPYQHLRVVTTALQVDKSLSDPIVKLFNDFFTNTGLGNIMVYSTTQQSENAPYNAAIAERAAGLSLDLSILNEAASSHAPYTPDGNYAWLNEHAADYGFILRYPADKAEKTGMNGLSWHYRYVGAPHAKYIADNKLCLEEYLELISNHPWDSEHLTTTVNGVAYEMYYVPASDTEAATTIKYPVSATGATPMISGDNIDGFVVAVPKQ